MSVRAEEFRVRCRQCGWSVMVTTAQVPRFGARIRCPACDSLQSIDPPGQVVPGVGPTACDPPAELSPKEPISASTEDASAPAETTAAPHAPLPKASPVQAALGEARQLLLVWLEDLQRERQTPLTARALFQEHAEELGRLYSMWRAAYPGDRAQEVFREQLLEALEGIEPAPTRHTRRGGEAGADAR